MQTLPLFGRYYTTKGATLWQKNTSVTLGDHFDGFIIGQVKSGRFSSASEVIRSALRLLENTETQLETLRKMLNDGEQSGVVHYDYDVLMDELDSNNDR